MPWAIGGAILGSSLLGGIASGNAASAQEAAANRSTEEQRRQFDLLQKNFAPYLQTGTQGLNRLQQAVLGGDISGFKEDPGFQYALNRGTGGIESSAAARGSLLSGQTLKGLQDYGQGMANQQYSNYLNRLMQLANMGQGAAGTLGQAGQNYANQYGNTQSQLGNIQAAAATAPFNTLMQGVGLAGGLGWKPFGK